MNKASDQFANRDTSIKRGLDFIYRVAATRDGFESYGSLLICCFALTGATSRDARLRQIARERAQTLAQRWNRKHSLVTSEVNPALAHNFMLVRYALSRIGLRDAVFNSQLRAAVKGFSVQDWLGFTPLNEPPPHDLSYACECGLQNRRGRKFCKQCRKRLQIQSRYGVWMRALASVYISERCGIRCGARYAEVLKWLPTMRPYPEVTEENIDLLRDAIYAVTHIVYTLNDYGTYRLRPRWLPQEFVFLKANVARACERKDPEVLGELLDSLKAFGLRAHHQLIIRGTKYLLATQNADGSWGDPDEENIRTRCHTTWTAIDGLRTYAWRGTRLIHPKVKALLDGRVKRGSAADMQAARRVTSVGL